MDETALNGITGGALLRVSLPNDAVTTAVWRHRELRDLGMSLDALLRLPLAEVRRAVSDDAMRDLPRLDPASVHLLAPADTQEVWAAGVTYLRSREARMAESQVQDVYARVYEADRPELFFKAAGWRVVPSGGDVGVRSDSAWNVPEPELAVLSNAHGEVVAFACANDMSSRAIEAENPLYLPQAKVYERSCAIGPAAVFAWDVDVSASVVGMQIVRRGATVFDGRASTAELVRDVGALTAVMHAAYPFPAGAWLLTGTSVVPPAEYTAEPGDVVRIWIDGLGTLVGRVVLIEVPAVTARPTIPR